METANAIFKFFVEGDHSKTLIGLAVGTVLGALVKFAFDEWSAKNHARREMIASVTKSVEDLSEKYYWHLANNASTLATIFNEYLNIRTKIQLSQNPPREQRNALAQLIKKKSTESFYYYARLTKSTYQFDWRAGSTFFLRDFWAGQTIRNLQNSLKEVLRLDWDLVDHVDAPGPDGKPRGSTPSDLLENDDLKSVIADYRKFFEDEEKVRKAAKYLETCGDLFYYELAQLYRDWFRFGRRGRVPREPPLGSRGLRKSVTTSTLETIRHIAESSRARGYVIAPLSSPSGLRPAETSALRSKETDIPPRPPPADSQTSATEDELPRPEPPAASPPQEHGPAAQATQAKLPAPYPGLSPDFRRWQRKSRSRLRQDDDNTIPACQYVTLVIARPQRGGGGTGSKVPRFGLGALP